MIIANIEIFSDAFTARVRGRADYRKSKVV